MQNPRLASRYAKSLMDLAIEQNKLEDVLANIKLVDSACGNSRELIAVLRSPIIAADKKQAILNDIFGNRLGTLTQGFIQLLVSKGREANLPEIAHSFIAMYKEMKNIKTVKLTTALPLNDTAKASLKAKITNALQGKEVEMHEAVNPDLIGGFVLEMDDKLFDASIRRDLNDVKTQFLKNIYVSELR